jgi:hypothetical protein
MDIGTVTDAVVRSIVLPDAHGALAVVSNPPVDAWTQFPEVSPVSVTEVAATVPGVVAPMLAGLMAVLGV